MSKIEIQLPAMGEGIIEATITRWLVALGDKVDVDQSIAEIATDKVDSEIPSPVSGVIQELLFKEGDVPQVGQIIAIIQSEESAATSVEKAAPQKEEPKTEEKPVAAAPKEKPAVAAESFKTDVYLSPLVKSIIKKESISEQEIGNIKGSGLDGRITKDDIISYVEHRNSIIERPKAQAQPKVQPQIPKQQPTVSAGGDVEIVEMDRMRKLIAEHMVMSLQTSAHVTSFIEVDVTNVMNWRNAKKDGFLEREGEKLTLTHLIVEATVKTLKQYPNINASVDGENIVLKKNINMGIATALPNGNLIVPVVANAQNLNLSGIAQQVNDLAGRARNNKLQPHEIQGGTFTITNLGMFDTLTGTPIINQPQVGILAVGAAKKRVVVIESPQGDTIGIRQMAIFSLSYDHRIVDGALAGMFLKTLKEILESY